MPNPEPPSPSEPAAGPTPNLPMLVPRPSEVARENGDGWFTRALRTLFGWKSSTIRADLKDVLEDGAGETGFSPTERIMLKNILGLRERRGAGGMGSRARILRAQRGNVLGGPMRGFESAGHVRRAGVAHTPADAART